MSYRYTNRDLSQSRLEQLIRREPGMVLERDGMVTIGDRQFNPWDSPDPSRKGQLAYLRSVRDRVQRMAAEPAGWRGQ